MKYEKEACDTCGHRWTRSAYAYAQSYQGFHCTLTESITKTRLFKYIENFTIKNWKFSDKKSDFFHISAQNIDCGYSLEPPRCIKVGFKGVKIMEVRFHDASDIVECINVQERLIWVCALRVCSKTPFCGLSRNLARNIHTCKPMKFSVRSYDKSVRVLRQRKLTVLAPRCCCCFLRKVKIHSFQCCVFAVLVYIVVQERHCWPESFLCDNCQQLCKWAEKVLILIRLRGCVDYPDIRHIIRVCVTNTLLPMSPPPPPPPHPPFQDYFTYIEPIVHQRWAKTGEPGEKPPDHP